MTRAGYRLARDDRGLTANERRVLALLVEGKSQTEAASHLRVSKQRIGQIVSALQRKGVVQRLPDQSVQIVVHVKDGRL